MACGNCWQAWAEDPDGRLLMYREIYRTEQTVADHANRIVEVTKDDPKPRAIICDHDAEGRATFEGVVKMPTVAAWKAVSDGIQAVQMRLRKAKDGRPRLFIMRDSLVDLDRNLLEKHRPTCTADEFDSYVWDTSSNRKVGEEPLKKNDHGMDALRYLVTYVDETGRKKLQLFPLSTSDLARPSAWRMESVAASAGGQNGGEDTIVGEDGRRIKFSDWDGGR